MTKDFCILRKIYFSDFSTKKKIHEGHDNLV